MAAHHPSPPAGMQLHHAAPNGPVPPMAPQQGQYLAAPANPMQQVVAMNESVWLQIGKMDFSCRFTVPY